MLVKIKIMHVMQGLYSILEKILSSKYEQMHVDRTRKHWRNDTIHLLTNGLARQISLHGYVNTNICSRPETSLDLITNDEHRFN